MKRLITYLIIFNLAFAAIIYEAAGQETSSHQLKMPDFMGQWIITDANGKIGWLEVRQEKNYTDADLMWREGNVDPVSDVYLAKNEYLVVTRTGEVVLQRDVNNNPLRSHIVTRWFEIKKDRENITGVYLQPRRNGLGIDSVLFTGKRMPPMPAAPDLSKVKYGKPISLIKDNDLSGWKFIDAGFVNGFMVKDDILINNAIQKENEPPVQYGNICTEQEFEDFNLKFEVNIPKGSNSGIYLRGMYELQIYDSYQQPLGKRNNMGAIYGRLAPSVNAEKPSGTWQTMDVTLCDRHITVILNDIKIIDNQPILGPTGEAIRSDVNGPGPLYIQGTRGSVSYRNMILTPIIK
jgi:hypothetical protein